MRMKLCEMWECVYVFFFFFCKIDPTTNQIMPLPCSKPCDGALFLSREKTKFLQPPVRPYRTQPPCPPPGSPYLVYPSFFPLQDFHHLACFVIGLCQMQSNLANQQRGWEHADTYSLSRRIWQGLVYALLLTPALMWAHTTPFWGMQ